MNGVGKRNHPGYTDDEEITQDILEKWLVEWFRLRRALALSFDDADTAVAKLHSLVNALTVLLILVIWIIFLGDLGSSLLVFLGSQILTLSFLFGDTCKRVFESVVFLFIVHPFDVQDRWQIDGVQLVVKEMNILTAVFLNDDGQSIIFPNTELASKTIINLNRKTTNNRTLESESDE